MTVLAESRNLASKLSVHRAEVDTMFVETRPVKYFHRIHRIHRSHQCQDDTDGMNGHMALTTYCLLSKLPFTHTRLQLLFPIQKTKTPMS